MVDLVKIRKKAKKAGQSAASSEQRAASSEEKAPLPTQDSGLSTQDSQPQDSQPQDSGLTTQDARPLNEKLERFKESAGTKREGVVRQAEVAVPSDQIEVLTFTLSAEQYAVGIEHIVEIVTPRVTAHVPNASDDVVGIMSLRGTIVTVMDVRRKLGHQQGSANGERRIVVVERGGETLGFEVDRVLRVVKLDAAAIEPHPVVHSSEQSEAIRGVFRHGGALTILLDLDKLLD